MLIRRLAAAAAVAAAVQLPSGAAAQSGPNLLVNGGFDAGLAGWTSVASPGYIVSAVVECNLDITCALFGTPGTAAGLATLSQTVATVPGTSYLASITTGQFTGGASFAFFLEAGGQRASFDCLSRRCVLAQPFTASGANATVTFGIDGFAPPSGGSFGGGGVVVDNATLVVLSAVPEPAAWATLFVGMVAFGASWRGRAESRGIRSAVGRFVPGGGPPGRGQHWLSRTGISRMTLNAVEAGQPVPTTGTYLRVMSALGVAGDLALVARGEFRSAQRGAPGDPRTA